MLFIVSGFLVWQGYIPQYHGYSYFVRECSHFWSNWSNLWCSSWESGPNFFGDSCSCFWEGFDVGWCLASSLSGISFPSISLTIQFYSFDFCYSKIVSSAQSLDAILSQDPNQIVTVLEYIRYNFLPEIQRCSIKVMTIMR